MSAHSPESSPRTDDVRQNLLDAAAQLFTQLSYDKVSTRAIAQRAQSNIGMIRYYFGNKAGLFETMCRQQMDLVRKHFNRFHAMPNVETLGDVIAGYYQVMLEVPLFPRLIQRAMSQPEDEPSRQIVQRLFNDIQCDVSSKMDKALANSNLRPDLDLQLVRLTIISLMVFPFWMPRAILDIHGITMNEEFLTTLANHHKELLKHGFSQ